MVTNNGWMILAIGVLLTSSWAISGCSRSTDSPPKAVLQPVNADGPGDLHKSGTRSTPASDESKQPAVDEDSTADEEPHNEASALADPSFGIGGVRTDDADDLRIVGSLISRYDRLVTELALDPTVATDPSSSVRTKWALLVPVESALSGSVLEQLVFRPEAEGTRLLPGKDGLSFEHHVQHTGRREDGSIEFSWCGYSPGVRIDSVSGEIIDDKVAHLVGIGRADRDPFDPQKWILDAFDQLDVDVMSPGSKNPCPSGNTSSTGQR